MKKIIELTESQLNSLVNTILNEDNSIKYTTTKDYKLGKPLFDINLSIGNTFVSAGPIGPNNYAKIIKPKIPYAILDSTPNEIIFDCQQVKRSSMEKSKLHLIYTNNTKKDYTPVYNNELEKILTQKFC